jgi:predicted alpha/beta-fold hydrolase
LTAREFAAPWWLRNPHLQTIYGSIGVPAPAVKWRRERWGTPDGDFVDVDFVDGVAGAPWVHLYHGLEGSSNSAYSRAIMHRVKMRGWNGSVFHFRGCSGEPNLLPRAYHSGDADEIDWSMREIKLRALRSRVYAVGISLAATRSPSGWRERVGAWSMVDGAAWSRASRPHGGRRRAGTRIRAQPRGISSRR